MQQSGPSDPNLGVTQVPRDSFNNLVRLTDSERDRLLDRLDRGASRKPRVAQGAAIERRKHPRLEYREADVPLVVEHPGGGGAWLLVCARNLSAGGMAFIHGGFLHVGSRCRLMLHRLNGKRELIGGEIVNCRHVEGALHEFSVRFDHKIEPSEFVAELKPADASEDSPEAAEQEQA
jgi:hypothetical protein